MMLTTMPSNAVVARAPGAARRAARRAAARVRWQGRAHEVRCLPCQRAVATPARQYIYVHKDSAQRESARARAEEEEEEEEQGRDNPVVTHQLMRPSQI